MIKCCFYTFHFQSLCFYLPSPSISCLGCSLKLQRNVVRLSCVKGGYFIGRIKKKGGTFNNFHINPKSRVQHENEIFLFILGLLRSFATKLKSISSISKLQTHGDGEAHGWQCVSLLFWATPPRQDKSLFLGQPAANLLVSGHFQVTHLSVIRKTRQNIAFCKNL